MVAYLDVGLFVTLLGTAVFCFLLINRVKILTLVSAVIFFGLTLFFVSDYDVVATTGAYNKTTDSSVYNATTGEKITNGTMVERVPNQTSVIIDSTSSGIYLGYIFFAFGIIAIIAYFGKALGAM